VPTTWQDNLGLAYWNRIRGDRADNVEKAIVAYEAALAVRTREALPQQWAATQNNLAIAYADSIRVGSIQTTFETLKSANRMPKLRKICSASRLVVDMKGEFMQITRPSLFRRVASLSA